MEPESAERTRRSSSRQPSRNVTYSASPLGSRSSAKKRKRKAKPAAVYYSVRDILEEQTKDEQTYYLIDWEDDPDTGASYTATWEPYHNVNWQAISAWEKKKSERQNRSAFDSRERSSTFDSDSEPIRKRQRIAGLIQSTSSEQDNEKSTSAHSVLQDKLAEIKDSYETQQTLSTLGTLSSEPKKLLALVPDLAEAFDRSAYAIISNISADPSHSNPSQESVYYSPPPESKKPKSAPRPFIWDEPVPDSQELPGSSSYIPSEQDTAPSQSTQPRSAYVSEASTNKSLEHSEKLSAPSIRRHLPDTPEVVSSPPPPAAKVLSQSQSTKNNSSRATQLSLDFIIDHSEPPEESWQPAQIRSPPPHLSQLSTQSASIPAEGSSRRPSTPSQALSSTNRTPQNLIDSIEGAEDIAWTHMSEVQDSSGSPLPPRPSPPSSSNMADQSIASSPSIADLLKQARAAAAANTIARQAEARAASATPSSQPPAVNTQPPVVNMQPPAGNQMLPLRSTSEAQPIASPSSRNSSESGSTTKGLQILPLGEEEYAVPLPLNSITRDIYDGEITNFRHQQKVFLKSEGLDLNLIGEIDTMLDRLKALCDHQDLIRSDPSTQEMDPWDVQAAWAENISTKCIFLSSILAPIRQFNIDVAVVVRPGRMIDILEALLRRDRVNVKRLIPKGVQPERITDCSLSVTLLPSDFYKHNIEIEPASLVIAFDSTFEEDRYPARLRASPRHPGSLAPLIRPTIVRSIEHFELCFDKQMAAADRRVALVSCVLQSRHEVGILPPGYYGPPEAARGIGFYTLDTPAERSWSLQGMPDIDGLEFELDTSDEAQPAEAQPNDGHNQAQASEATAESYGIPPSQLLQPTFKRSLSSEDDDDASTKRQRLTPVINEAVRVAHHSNIGSLLNPTDSEPSSRSEGPEARADEPNLSSSLAKKVKDLELELQRRDASYAELRSHNQLLESSCADLESSIQAVQPKFQEALTDRDRFEYDMKEAATRASTLQQRLDLRVSELSKLKEEKAASDAELVAARAALAGSAIPEVAELGRMREEMVTMRAENERLNKRIASMLNELEYMRTNYQQASSAAAEAVSDLNDVKAELSAAQQKASENAVRIHEIQASSEISQHLARIRELEAEKAATEWELEKKSEELKAMLNGRRATRGTSVPRSPRMGTMSPGSRPMARVLSVGSRGTSPAPGDGPPYRGTFTGEALFTTAPPSSRFGNHLM